MKRKVDRFTKLTTELFQMLDDKEARIRALEVALKARQTDADAEWMLPRVFKRNQNRLPVPRLEIRCQSKGDWSHYTWVYGLFYKHYDGHYLLLPLWMSKVSGGSGMPVRAGRPQSPRNAERLIRYDMEHFGLPGFIVVNDLVEELSLEPKPKRH